MDRPDRGRPRGGSEQLVPGRLTPVRSSYYPFAAVSSGFKRFRAARFRVVAISAHGKSAVKRGFLMPEFGLPPGPLDLLAAS